MSIVDLTNLNPEQERILCDAYRYIRQRAAWVRTQQKVKIGDSKTTTKSHSGLKKTRPEKTATNLYTQPN
jgi:hypothetical protein